MDKLDKNFDNLEKGDAYEFNLDLIFASVLRKRNIFLSIASSILFFSFVYAYTRKPIWQGQFQIVLNQDQKSSINNTLLDNLNNSGLRLIGNRLSRNTNLNTELEILQSPSVLKPIFDFVKDQKEKNGKKISNFRFEDWSQNIAVSLRPKTSVLDLYYRDTDKNLILPVINKISDAYKGYPDRDKSKVLLKSIKYFEDQISYYLDLSEKAFRNYIAFSLENNLNAFPIKKQYKIIDENKVSIEIDPRLLLQNKIKELEFTLNEIDNINLSEYDDKILPLEIYFSQNEDEQRINNAVKGKVVELSEKRQFFTEKDKVVKNLKKNIKNLNNILHNSAKDNLRKEIIILQNRLKIINKPKDIVIKSKVMQREVIRLEKIVNTLENNKQLLSLQLAEKSNPWELISKPTLNENPISPRKKQIVILGFLSGITLGMLGVIYIENLSGVIYNLKELKYLIKYKFLQEINIDEDNKMKDSLRLISKKLNQISNIKDIGLLFLSELSTNDIDTFRKNLMHSLKNVNLVYSSNFNDLTDCDSIILIIQKGKITRNQLEEYDQKLKLLDIPIIGWIFLKNT